MTGVQIFYTHVMKTAGRSLSSLIRAHLPTDVMYPDAAHVTAKIFSDRLLNLDELERERYPFISVHHPAWVAFAAAPAAFKMTVLREPVARTVSHLRQIARGVDTPDDIEEIYAVTGWRDRLSNYQTQLFAAVGPSHTSQLDDPSPPMWGLQGGSSELDDEKRAALLRELAWVWYSGIAQPIEVDAASFERAVAMLERYDCVGVTEDLSGVVTRLSERTGLALPSADHLNRTSNVAPVGRALLDQIANDNEFDLLLHAAARELASS